MRGGAWFVLVGLLAGCPRIATPDPGVVSTPDAPSSPPTEPVASMAATSVVGLEPSPAAMLRARLAEQPDDVPTEVEAVTSSAGVAFVYDAMLCVRIDDVWRCTDDTWLTTIDGRRVRVEVAVHDAVAVVVPVEVARCEGGSELSECTERLHLLRMDGAALHDDGSMPLGASFDDHMRMLDDDDRGATRIGTLDAWRWQLQVDSPICIRAVTAKRTVTKYAYRFRDAGSARKSASEREQKVRFGARPATLPRAATWPSPYDPPDDLRGVWQLADGVWRRVDRCERR
jgi:hypothetical protein